MSLPVLFQRATVVSGEDDPSPYVSDVLVIDGLIAKIGEALEVPSGARVIPADGHILCPGFIDMHAHSDLYLLTHPEHEAKISQGCTVRDPPVMLLISDGSRWARRYFLLPHTQSRAARSDKRADCRLERQPLGRRMPNQAFGSWDV